MIVVTGVLGGLALVVLSVFGALAWADANWRPKYHDPQLHDGRWELYEIHNGNVVWHRQDASHSNGLHVHRPQVCSIMRGLAHTDMCACGQKRYGVFGSWS